MPADACCALAKVPRPRCGNKLRCFHQNTHSLVWCVGHRLYVTKWAVWDVAGNGTYVESHFGTILLIDQQLLLQTKHEVKQKTTQFEPMGCSADRRGETLHIKQHL